MTQKRKKQSIFKSIDKPLFFITIAFFVFGLLNIVTASSRAAVVNYNYDTIYYYFYRQLVFIFVGVIGGLIILKLKSKNYKLFMPLLYIGIIALNLLALTYDALNGSQNWIDLGVIKIQPSEFSKPLMIVLLALLFEGNYKKLRDKKINHWNIIGTILLLAVILLGSVFLQKDFGTLSIIIFICFVIFICSPILRIEKFKIIVGLLVLMGAALFLMFCTKGYILDDARMSRFTSFLDPCGTYENGGYQVCNGFIAINDGGLTGLGIGKSKQKYSYIPEPHTDSVFAIIAEEYGIYRTAIIFLGYIIILWRILLIGSNSSTIRGRYICIGVASYIFIHIFLNLGGLFGVIPLTGVPLPFLSYGGSFVISLIASLALVQRVKIETKTKKITIKEV